MASDPDKDSCSKPREELSPNHDHGQSATTGSQVSEFVGEMAQGFREEVKYHNLELQEQIKASLQAVADSQRRYWSGVESRLIFWSGIIAVILAASAGLLGLRDGFVIGAVVVCLAVAGRAYLWTWFMRKRMKRVDSFRERFRKLLDSVGDVRWQTRTEEMVSADQAFLERYKDSILFPWAATHDKREEVRPNNLAHVETLWIEYLGYAHAHLPGPTECQAGSFPTGEGSPEAASPVSGRTDIRTSGKCEFPWADPECKLCMTADHVRKHIDGAISAYEAAVASARQELTTQIDNAAPGGALDAKAFLDEYSKRKTFYYVPEDLADQDEKLLVWLNSLCDRQRWTFEDADKVRELCRIRAKGKSHWLESYEQENRFDHLVGKLTQEMKNAANRCGLAEIWDWYDSAKQRLNEGEIKKVRRILGRHNPEAMFRELEEEFGGPLMGTIISHRLPGITKWGYDPKFVDKTVKTATKLISREGEDEFDRELHRELRTMQALVRRERRGA